MKVCEIFDSIQGEGDYMGYPATFIRLAGCNLDCPFCDEKSKYDDAVEMTVAEILEKVNHHIVVITGGEPTTQDCSELVMALVVHHRVHVETNGTNNPVWLSFCWVTVSPKGNYPIKCKYDELKYVIQKETLVSDLNIPVNEEHSVWLQPCDDKYYNANVRRCIELCNLCERWRVGIQLHKVIGVK